MSTDYAGASKCLEKRCPDSPHTHLEHLRVLQKDPNLNVVSRRCNTFTRHQGILAVESPRDKGAPKTIAGTGTLPTSISSLVSLSLAHPQLEWEGADLVRCREKESSGHQMQLDGPLSAH